MLLNCATAQNFWINMVSPKDGVSNNRSLRTIITGLTLQYRPHLSIPFVSYAQVHDDSDNTMQSHTVGAITLRLMDNASTGYFFLSFNTGQPTSAQSWTELLMPHDIT